MIEDFICNYCGEEIDGNFKFRVFVNEYIPGECNIAISCPDCIATWFTETPEEVMTMRIVKMKGE
ncbi:unnamed protein product [marine sediment metagenome]|uniref:Uncharacterized protein n=1 Tax=marine sediment metagenome TaxID=412755 RepID=X1J0H5_9ZZZZ